MWVFVVNVLPFGRPIAKTLSSSDMNKTVADQQILQNISWKLKFSLK